MFEREGAAVGDRGELIRAATEAIAVELVGGDAEKKFSPTLLGPGRDVDRGGGLGQTGSEKQVENLAARKFELLVGGRCLSI